MADPIYTLPQLKDHWQDYQSVHWYKVVKGGQVFIRRTAPDMNEEPITKCEMVKAALLVSFPKYLEMISA